MTVKVVFFNTPGTGSFVVPPDFLSFVSLEVLGAGQSGGSNNAGGGAGAYSKSTSVSANIKQGSVLYYSIGLAGTDFIFSVDTWVNVGTNAAPTLATQGALAKGGGFATTTSSGGGAAASGVGDVRYSGGNGYIDNIGAGSGSAGGGGAAGPGGNGGDSSAGVANNGGNGGRGGGGGGATLTGPGQAAGAASLTQGGAGGNNGSGIGGGLGATSAINSTSGTGGGGGGGGFGGGLATYNIPGAGSNGTIWTSTHVVSGGTLSPSIITTGPGGGGGGAGGSVTNIAGGAGGLGAGGGGSYSLTAGGGAGGNGIAVLTYNALANYNTNLYTPATGYVAYDANSGSQVDLGSRYVTKSYLLDVYPNLATTFGARTTPGLWVWGLSALYGAVNYSSPIQVGSLATWKMVTQSQNGQTFAIKNDGTLWAWGSQTVGELGIGVAATPYYSPVQVGAANTWKTVHADGYGQATVHAITTDGRLFAWGRNAFGEMGINTVLTKYYSLPVQVGALTSWKQISHTTNNFLVPTTTYGITTDNKLYSWGGNSFGQMGIGTTNNYFSSPVQVGTLSNWKQVVGGSGMFFAVKTDGTLWGCGYGGGSVSTAFFYTTLNYSSPIQLGSLNNWKQVAANAGGGMAVKTDGTLWGWGYNGYANLGIGTTASQTSPIQVGTLTNWKTVVCSPYQSIAIKTDGTAWSWGGSPNSGYSLGQGSSTFAGLQSPVQIGSLTTWKSVYISSLLGAGIIDGYI